MSRSFVGRVAALAIVVVCATLATEGLQAEPVAVDTLPSAAAGAGKQPKEVTDALTRFKNKDFDGALKLLQAAKKKHPELPPAQVVMAQLFAAAKQPAAVRSSLEQAVVGHPDDPEAYLILGDLCMQERRTAEAGLLYAKAGSLAAAFKGSSKRKNILQQRADAGQASAAEVIKDWASAGKHLADWLKLAPSNAMALHRMGRVLFHQDKADEALAKFKEAAKDNKKVLTPEASLAQLYQQAGDRTNATKWMVAALTAAPKDLRTRLVAAQWSLETEQLDQAREQAAAAMKLDPGSLEAKLLRGVIALFMKDYKAAELYFESAHLQSPSNFAASNNLALALCEQDDEAKKNRALEYAQVNARQYPKQAEAASTYGWILYKLGRIDDAERALRAAAARGSLSPDTAYYIARVSADRGRKDEAKRLLEQALKTKRLFSQRVDAEALLKELNK